MRQGTGEGKKLLLPCLKRHAPFLDRLIKTFGKTLDKIQDIHLLRRPAHLFIGDPWCAHADIAGNGSGEEEGILQDHTEIGAQVMQPQLPDVNTFQQNLAVQDVVKAQQQVGERGFACARVPTTATVSPGSITSETFSVTR